MRKYMTIALACMASLGAETAQAAGYVSYPGGVTLMTMNDGDVNALHALYSPTAKTSIGYNGEYWREGDYNIQALRMNNLLKRWNNPDSQANFYLQSGAGVAISDDDTQPAAFTGIVADWEDRRFYTSYENRYTYAGDTDQFFMQAARVGVAPYVAEYGATHTWLMLQIDHKPEAEDQITVMPLVRVFKGTHLVEAGINNKGKVLFNWIVRF